MSYNSSRYRGPTTVLGTGSPRFERTLFHAAKILNASRIGRRILFLVSRSLPNSSLQLRNYSLG